MKKSTIQGYVVLAVILAAFCAIAFAVPFVKNAVFWLAFAFTLVAFGVEVYAFRTSFGKEDVCSKFYGFPIARLAVVYFIVQLVLALVLMALAQWVPVWVAVILFVVVLAAGFPVGSVPLMFCVQYDKNSVLAGECLAFTAVLCCVSTPLVYLILNLLMGAR